jgi:hypothetical protein
VGAVVLLASKGLLLELKSALRLVRVAIWGENFGFLIGIFSIVVSTTKMFVGAVDLDFLVNF